MKAKYIIIGLIAVVAILAVWFFYGSGENGKNYKTAKIEKGNIVQTVKATGSIQPIDKVEVGSQVSGRILKLYADYNSQVKKGQLIAQIDPTQYKDRVAQNRANHRKSEGALEEVKAKLDQAKKEYERDLELAQKNLVSQSDLDASKTNCDVLAAQLKSARASLEQARAALSESQTDLDYTSIVSPVDGVVIDRNVNEGQAVVASLSVQTIFVIATDLTQIQVEASVAEADIGQIKEGQSVTFTVDAFPNDTFVGKVTQVRIAATTVQNVVTYPVIITADNSAGKLFPGMTANVSFEVATHKDVLKIPNAALRFKPEEASSKKKESETSENGSKNKVENHKGHSAKVWINTPEGLISVSITTGISDSSFTELLSGDLKVGQEVIVGILAEGEKKQTVNPFTPKFPGRRGAH